MVNSATNWGKNGLQDWLVQRVTAVILLLYLFFLVGYWILHPQLSYSEWYHLFTSPVMQMGSLLVLLSLAAHAWIGMWTVITDYVKPLFLRLLIEVSIIIGLLIEVIWGIKIIWRI